MFVPEDDIKWPEYASNLRIDLFLDEETSSYFVSVTYNDNVLKLNGPDMECFVSLEKFRTYALHEDARVADAKGESKLL